MQRNIIYIFSLFLSLSIFSTSTFAQNDTLTIMQLSDIHVCTLKTYHPEFVKLRQHYGNGMSPLTDFIEHKPKELGADAVIITGDLIDYYEAETADGKMLATQVEQFVPVYSSSIVPMYLTLGNHDITTYWINDSLQKEQSQLDAHKARAAWIRNISCFREGTYYSRSFQLNETTFRLIFLDNGYSLGNGSYLDKTQLDWLESQVKQYDDDPVVIFMHKYLPVADLNEDSVVFTNNPTLILNEQTCSRGFLRILNESTIVKALFCGHGHKNVSEWLVFPSGHKIVQTETGGFANDINNWRLIKFTRDQIIIDSTGSDKIEYLIKIK
jgi:predicted MPP superfamily phosphohydrolase